MNTPCTALLAAACFAAALPLGAKAIGNCLDADGRPLLSPPVRKLIPAAAKSALPARLAVEVPKGSETLVELLDRALKARWRERGGMRGR